jgi:hypothetical protein
VSDPVEPVNPSPKVGEGKSFVERIERGMKNDDPEIKRQFAEKLEKYVNEGKVLNEQRNEYKKNLGNRPVQSGGGAGPALGDIEKMMSSRIKKPNYKSGGKVISMASRRADGCCVKGKTRGRMI